MGCHQGGRWGVIKGVDRGAIKGVDGGVIKGFDVGVIKGVDLGVIKGVDGGAIKGLDGGVVERRWEGGKKVGWWEGEGVEGEMWWWSLVAAGRSMVDRPCTFHVFFLFVLFCLKRGTRLAGQLIDRHAQNPVGWLGD